MFFCLFGFFYNKTINNAFKANSSTGHISLDEFIQGAQRSAWVQNFLRLDVNPSGWIRRYLCDRKLMSGSSSWWKFLWRETWKRTKRKVFGKWWPDYWLLETHSLAFSQECEKRMHLCLIHTSYVKKKKKETWMDNTTESWGCDESFYVFINCLNISCFFFANNCLTLIVCIWQ